MCESSESVTTLRFSRRPSVRADLYLSVIAVLCLLSLFDVPFYQATDSPLWQVALVDEDEVDRSEAKVSQFLSDDDQDSASAGIVFRIIHPQQRFRQSPVSHVPHCCAASSLIIRAPPTV